MLTRSLVMAMELLIPVEIQENMPGVPKAVTFYLQWQVILRDAGLYVDVKS